MKKLSHAHFWEYLLGLGFAAFLTLKLLYQQDKPKSEHLHIQRRIASIAKTYQDLPSRDAGKYRYLILQNFDKPLELFIGHGRFEFAPEVDKVDQLKPGDVIDVYYEDVYKEEEQSVRRGVYTIEKNDVSFYKEGDSRKPLANGIMGIIVLTLIGLLYLKSKGWIGER